jgi:hypothetical protein
LPAFRDYSRESRPVEPGFNDHFAQQQFDALKSRNGSISTDIVHPRHVGFFPNNDRNSDLPCGR